MNHNTQLIQNIRTFNLPAWIQENSHTSIQEITAIRRRLENFNAIEITGFGPMDVQTDITINEQTRRVTILLLPDNRRCNITTHVLPHEVCTLFDNRLAHIVANALGLD